MSIIDRIESYIQKNEPGIAIDILLTEGELSNEHRAHLIVLSASLDRYNLNKITLDDDNSKEYSRILLGIMELALQSQSSIGTTTPLDKRKHLKLQLKNLQAYFTDISSTYRNSISWLGGMAATVLIGGVGVFIYINLTSNNDPTEVIYQIASFIGSSIAIVPFRDAYNKFLELGRIKTIDRAISRYLTDDSTPILTLEKEIDVISEYRHKIMKIK